MPALLLHNKSPNDTQIDKHGTTTVWCNRMDMVRGIETALAIERDTSAGEKPDTPALLAQFKNLATTPGALAPGVVFQADISKLTTAANTISAELVSPHVNHAQMEPLACAVDLKADSCQLYGESRAIDL